jgi:dUTP pyrophosphatase
MTTLNVNFVLNDERAIVLTKAHEDDVGFDLTAIKVYKILDNGVYLFDTGISVSPPAGYYCEILPRSSISKTGWMLANSVGIIDPNYTGNLLIALIKVSTLSPPLELPFTKCQLILRKIETFQMVQTNSLKETDRGDGGFGSTDKPTS